jgi:uncharacterized membrane protein YkvA (DUF1232 family)
MEILGDDNKRSYSDNGFWEMLRRHAKTAGRTVVMTALRLWYAAQRPDVPVWAKTTIYSALGYFILPADALPDLLPGGYVDDLGVLAAATAMVAIYINADVRAKAKNK